jgi:hypothetical protein
MERVMAILTDPLTGASDESIAALRANMARPEVANAVQRHLIERNLDSFNPENIPEKMPQKLIQLMHKHAPTLSSLRRYRGTHLCTIVSNSCRFGSKGKPLQDARVLSLNDVGDQALNIFAGYSAEFFDDPLIHRKMHAVFLTAEDKCTKFNLCDMFEWCKCSALLDESTVQKYGNADGEFCPISTPFGIVFLFVNVLTNAEECRVEILNGDKTVQIKIKDFKPSTIGIRLYTTNMCMQCRKTESDTVRLKKCSRCLKCFYCSQECQLLDYPTHRSVCTYDWSSSDWRENAPVMVRQKKI